MSLETKYPNEVKHILSKYPPEHKRSAVMPLLYLAQREEGYLTKAAMQARNTSPRRDALVKTRSNCVSDADGNPSPFRCDGAMFDKP